MMVVGVLYDFGGFWKYYCSKCNQGLSGWYEPIEIPHPEKVIHKCIKKSEIIKITRKKIWGYYCHDCEIFVSPDEDGDLYCYQCGFTQNIKDVKKSEN